MLPITQLYYHEKLDTCSSKQIYCTIWLLWLCCRWHWTWAIQQTTTWQQHKYCSHSGAEVDTDHCLMIERNAIMDQCWAEQHWYHIYHMCSIYQLLISCKNNKNKKQQDKKNLKNPTLVHIAICPRWEATCPVGMQAWYPSNWSDGNKSVKPIEGTMIKKTYFMQDSQKCTHGKEERMVRGALPAKMVKITIRKLGYNLFWIEFH